MKGKGKVMHLWYFRTFIDRYYPQKTTEERLRLIRFYLQGALDDHIHRMFKDWLKVGERINP